MGLQTVSWLHKGEVLHRDSTGSLQTIRPRQLGLMTSGRAISHSEESPKPHARFLHGAQLWVALPDSHRHTEPRFEYHPDLPEVTAPGLDATLILGELAGVASPGTTYTPVVGADLTLTRGADVRLPLEADFEYAVLSMSGEAHVDGVPVLPGSMLYLGCGRVELPLRAESDASLMLLGGEPFEEELIMWWNFIGRTQEDIAQARTDWTTGSRFGEVKGYDGDPLPAPDLPPVPLKPRGRAR
jgi:redox-sensitive bicupin YhaK (pirin superfamily)